MDASVVLTANNVIDENTEVKYNIVDYDKAYINKRKKKTSSVPIYRFKYTNVVDLIH